MCSDHGTATFEDGAAVCDGGSCLVRKLAGVVEVTVEGHPGGSILGLLLREMVICNGGVDPKMEHSRLAICEEGMLFPVMCLMRGGVPLGVLLSDEISEERRKEGKMVAHAL